MDYPCAKFGNYTFSRFGFIVQTDRQTYIIKESHADAAHRLTHATVIGVSNNYHTIRQCTHISACCCDTVH